MEIKAGLSGRILPDESEEFGLEPKKEPSSGRKKWTRLAIGCSILACAGIAVFFAYNSGKFKLPNTRKENQEKIEEGLVSQPLKLNIDSNPKGASIYIDGSAIPKFTPSQVENVNDGEHLLQLFQGNKKWEANLGIESGIIKKINAHILESNSSEQKQAEEKGIIFLSSNPAGARIFINNKDTQKNTPFEFSDLSSGNYLLFLSSEGFSEWSGEVVVENNKRIELLAILKEEKTKVGDALSSGWRSYENRFYGIKMLVPIGWKIGEFSKDLFDRAFLEHKDSAEYSNADVIVALATSQDEQPPISIAINSRDKAAVLNDFSGSGFVKLEEESKNFNMDLFESAQSQDERFAVFKSTDNPYVFLISFHGFGGIITEDIFNKFLLELRISKPEIF